MDNNSVLMESLDDIIYLDKQQKLFLQSRIILSPISLVDLLTCLEDDMITTLTLNNLECLDKNLIGDKLYCYSRSFFSDRRVITDETYIEKLFNDEAIVYSICSIFHYYPELHTPNQTIYNVVEKIRNVNTDMVELSMAVNRILSHPKVDPLLVSIILRRDDLIKKYMFNKRSNKFKALNYLLLTGVLDITFNKIIRKTAKRILLYKEIFGNVDVLKYLLSFEII